MAKKDRQPKACIHCGEIPKWDEFDWWLHDSETMEPPPCMYYNDEDEDACYGGWEQELGNLDMYDQLHEAYYARESYGRGESED